MANVASMACSTLEDLNVVIEAVRPSLGIPQELHRDSVGPTYQNIENTHFRDQFCMFDLSLMVSTVPFFLGGGAPGRSTISSRVISQ